MAHGIHISNASHNTQYTESSSEIASGEIGPRI